MQFFQREAHEPKSGKIPILEYRRILQKFLFSILIRYSGSVLKFNQYFLVQRHIIRFMPTAYCNSTGCLSVRPSVCLSVVFRCFVQKNEELKRSRSQHQVGQSF